jgi:hypothetical protein
VLVATAFGLALTTASSANWWPVIPLGLLFIGAEHRDRLFPDETGLSGSIAVALASACYFADARWIGGAFLVCAAGALYVPHIRQRELPKIIVNAACFGLSGLTSAAVIALGPSFRTSVLGAIVCLVLGVATYWVVNCALLAIATSALRSEPLRNNFAKLIRADTIMLIFGLGGAACGLVMTEVSTAAGVASLCALLVVLDVFVISLPSGLSSLRSAWAIVLTRLASGGVAGTMGAVLVRAVGVGLLGAMAGLTIGIAAGCLVIVVGASATMLTRHRHLDVSLVAGLVPAELAWPMIGAACGVAVALLGMSTGLIVSSVLFVFASLLSLWRRDRVARIDRAHHRVVDDDDAFVAVLEALLDGLPSPTREG